MKRTQEHTTDSGRHGNIKPQGEEQFLFALCVKVGFTPVQLENKSAGLHVQLIHLAVKLTGDFVQQSRPTRGHDPQLRHSPATLAPVWLARAVDWETVLRSGCHMRFPRPARNPRQIRALRSACCHGCLVLTRLKLFSGQSARPSCAY